MLIPQRRTEAHRMSTDAITLMKDIALFQDMGEGELNLIWAMGQEVGMPANRSLAAVGNDPQAFWILLEGTVAIRSAIAGREPSIVPAPDVWGVAALVPPYRSPGTAVTVTACRLVRIESANVRQLTDTNPRLGARLYQAIAAHILRRVRALSVAPAES